MPLPLARTSVAYWHFAGVPVHVVPVAQVSTAFAPPLNSGESHAVPAATVPLTFSYVTTPVHETLEELVTTHQAPVYIVHFTQAEAVERAQALTSVAIATRSERDAIADAIGSFRFTAGSVLA